MSTGAKRALKDATLDAVAFRDLFHSHTARWTTAGSVRRGKAEVGDIEHVVIPIAGGSFLTVMDEMLPQEGIFAQTGIIEKAVYPNGTHRWGQRYRGVMFRGFRHEVFMADAMNWGCILTIRTGPAEFSRRMVTALHPRGMRQHEGYLRDAHGNIIACPDEQTFFALCGVNYLAPHERE